MPLNAVEYIKYIGFQILRILILTTSFKILIWKLLKAAYFIQGLLMGVSGFLMSLEKRKEKNITQSVTFDMSHC